MNKLMKMPRLNLVRCQVRFFSDIPPSDKKFERRNPNIRRVTKSDM